jgi:phosphonate transport system substrate-binding protein
MLPMTFRNNSFKAYWVLAVLLAALLMTACAQTPTPSATPTPEIAPTLTPLPTITATPYPIGTIQSPLILGIVSETNDPAIQDAGDKVASSIQQVTGFVVKAKTYSSYLLLISDMAFAKVHIAFLPPLTYLYASQMGYAQVAMVTNHFGVYQYGTRFFANAASKFKPFYDPVTDRATAGAAIALNQFQTKRPCWVDAKSPSGYVVPLGILNESKTKISDGAYLGSPVGVIRALYITGICDFGVTFTTSGDPRTAPAVSQDLTDVLNRVVVIWQSDPLIPNTSLTFHPSLRKDMRADLIFGFKDLLKDEKGRSALSTANNYDIVDLKPADEALFAPLGNLVKQAGIDLLSFVGR